LGVGHKRDAYFSVMAAGRMWAKGLHGENGDGVGARHATGWAGTLALLTVLGGILRLAVDAIAGVVG
jgi:hypothetical protein